MSTQRSEQTSGIIQVSSSTGKHIPKDAQVIIAIMKGFGIKSYESKVINVLLEFIYKYTTTVLDDAKLFSSHAKKKNIEADDVKLAITMQSDRLFSHPPPRDMLLELARMKNSTPLPSIKVQSGIKLPPDRYCLLQTNYRMKPTIGTGHKKKNETNKSHPSTPPSGFSSKDNKFNSPSIKQMPTIPQNSSSFNIGDIKFLQDIKTTSSTSDNITASLPLESNNFTEKTDIKNESEMMDVIMEFSSSTSDTL